MHFTVEAQRFVARALSEGAIAIDATAGNGFDTLFLAQQVGESGRVYAVDIQPNAIEVVKDKLTQKGLSHRCKFVIGSHDRLSEWLDAADFGMVSVAMMNLGYLPFGDKSIVTQRESTIQALHQLHATLRVNGVMSILAYRGHAGGDEEAASVAAWIERYRSEYQVEKFFDTGNEKSPILWILVKQT